MHTTYTRFCFLILPIFVLSFYSCSNRTEEPLKNSNGLQFILRLKATYKSTDKIAAIATLQNKGKDSLLVPPFLGINPYKEFEFYCEFLKDGKKYDSITGIDIDRFGLALKEKAKTLKTNDSISSKFDLNDYYKLVPGDYMARVVYNPTDMDSATRKKLGLPIYSDWVKVKITD